MLWGGRFSEPTNDDLRTLNDSIDFDKRLYAEDIRGSIAWARAIAQAGIISDEEANQIVAGLEQVRAEFEAGAFAIMPGDEDIHTAVERRLTEIVGAVGGKLHTGRSRNDQVATDFAMWTQTAAHALTLALNAALESLVLAAEPHTDTLMPGYTHIQPAQPITAAHWLMSYFWMLLRDRDALVAYPYSHRMPLGSGALAGTPLPVSREALAETLGFAHISANSLDAVSDRDFAAELLFRMTMIGIHLSRLAEDIVWFSNPALGFITLDDRYSTGSSLMPQKRNPDPMELARGKAGRLIGSLTGFLTTLKGLPTGYNKDLQEDKEPVFDSYDTLMAILPVFTAVIRTLRLNPDQMRAALHPDMLATDLADYLVKKGMPFREAHHVSGRAVRLAAEKGVTFTELTPADLRGLSPLFDEDVSAVFDFAASVVRRNSPGGTAPEAVRGQIQQAKRALALDLDKSHNAE
jgi:argininosuccinate lyase